MFFYYYFYKKSYIYNGDIMLDKIYDYVSDNEFKFTIYEDKIHVVNYKRIISLEDDYISFQSINYHS